MTKVRNQSTHAMTIRGVAQHAGVSPVNVSNVLNGRRVTAPIREVVERSIAELIVWRQRLWPRIGIEKLGGFCPEPILCVVEGVPQGW
jgi:hypothetical protein